MNIQTLKGFRDFLPHDMRRRQYAIDKIKEVFASHGFEPLETPALEYEELLIGKYGDEGDKLMYRFEDNGKRRVAMRYDQTVPLARVIAQHASSSSVSEVITIPFKRYQIQPVWRADKPQRGRFREFLQCDADTVGIDTPLSDADILMTAAKIIDSLGFSNYKILLNDRKIFSDLVNDPSQVVKEQELPGVIRAIDKLKKIGSDRVIDEMVQNGISIERATHILQTLQNLKPTQRLTETLLLLKQMGLKEEQYMFFPTLARGLDYYTGLIFEIELEEYTVGSVAGGGRYNNLIGMFAQRQIPAVGFALGFDRIMEALSEQKLFPTQLQTTDVLVSIFSTDLQEEAIKICNSLHAKDIRAEIYLDSSHKIEKQLKYADIKKIPFVIIQGPNELEKKTVIVRNMQTREQKEILLTNIGKPELFTNN